MAIFGTACAPLGQPWLRAVGPEAMDWLKVASTSLLTSSSCVPSAAGFSTDLIGLRGFAGLFKMLTYYNMLRFFISLRLALERDQGF